MQVSFYKYPSEYELQNEGYVPQNYPTRTISANNHDKIFRCTEILNYTWYLSLMYNYYFRKMCYFVKKCFLKNTCCTVNYYLCIHVACIVL